MESCRKTIYLVDDDMLTLTLGNDILAADYDIFTMNSGARLLKMLEKRIPDLILLDIEMPKMNGYDTINYLKENNFTKHIPVIFLTAKSDMDNELKGLSLGAIDYIIKPFSPPLLLKRIEVHLLVEGQRKELEMQKHELINFNNNLQEIVEVKTKAVVELQNAVINTFAELIEHRDEATGGHIGRTQEYLRILLETMVDHPLFGEEIKTWDTALILQSAQLHDVGKIAIKDNILQKPGKLTEDEYETIKLHVSFGEKVIDKIISITSEHAFLEQARVMVSTHHERWDGNGYPKKLKGRDIPLQGRIMAIVDVYDALISERPYKNAYTHEEVVEIIVTGKGSQFDPDLVELFLSLNEEFKTVSTSGVHG